MTDAIALRATRALAALALWATAASAVPAQATAARRAAADGVPDKVLQVLKVVDERHQPPEGFQGGRTFGNFEQRLPRADARGKRVRYQEWDVKPLRKGANRGVERLITGSDGSAWYTRDHYATFTRIRATRTEARP